MHAWLILCLLRKGFTHIVMPLRFLMNGSEHTPTQGLSDKLMVSGLSPALKAEKRADLAREFAAIVDTRVDTELRIKREGKNGSKDRGSDKDYPKQTRP